MLTSPRSRPVHAHAPETCGSGQPATSGRYARRGRPIHASGPHGPRLMTQNARILELGVRHADPHQRRRPQAPALRGAHRAAPRMKPL
ncbi:hypothetical protein [Streptomyces sp. NPDC058683]|uniref:hypothetical protein n=1 Tax=Streptomyces sp. NPDC058683 TaxID=3346597 RepID=UPI00365510C2